MTLISACCEAELKVGSSGEGTNWYECSSCGAPCQVRNVGEEQTNVEDWVEHGGGCRSKILPTGQVLCEMPNPFGTGADIGIITEEEGEK